MGFSSRGNNERIISEINVTPLVDVMLVLLIIFMVTAPMMTQGIDVDLPQTTAQPLPQKTSPTIITMTRKGTVYLRGVKTKRVILRQKMRRLARAGASPQVLLKADRRVPYGKVVAIMADIRRAGIKKFGMITEAGYQKAEK